MTQENIIFLRLTATATHSILHLTDPYSLLSGAAQYFSHKAHPMID